LQTFQYLILLVEARNWLDLLWLAHNRQMSALKSEAIEQLPKLINIENVVAVLVCAHTIGEKKVSSFFLSSNCRILSIVLDTSHLNLTSRV
jgi:hypothetical protein